MKTIKRKISWIYGKIESERGLYRVMLKGYKKPLSYFDTANLISHTCARAYFDTTSLISHTCARAYRLPIYAAKT